MTKNKELFTKLYNRIFDEAVVPEEALVFHDPDNKFTMRAELRVAIDRFYKERCATCFKELLKDSSVGDRFKWKSHNNPRTTHIEICMQIEVWPRLGEKVEDLFTVLKMEGIL